MTSFRAESNTDYDLNGEVIDSLVVSGVENMSIRNFSVRGSGQAGILVESSSNVQIEDYKVDGFQMGVWIKGARNGSGLRGGLITGCQIGMSISGPVLVEGNEVDGLELRGLGDADYARGWNGKNSGGSLIFRNNWFHGAEVDRLEAAGSHVDAFQTFVIGGGELHNFVFTNNVVEDFHEGIIGQDRGIVPSVKQKNWIITNNIFARGKGWIATLENVNGITFENNYATDISPQGLGIRFGSIAYSIQNNIFNTRIGVWADPESEIQVIDNNVYYEVIRNRPGAVMTDVDPQIGNPVKGVYLFRDDSPLKLLPYGPLSLKGTISAPGPTIPVDDPPVVPDPPANPPTDDPSGRKPRIRAALDSIADQITVIEDAVWE